MFKTEVSGSGYGLEKIMDPDPVCPERLDPDPDPVCPESLDTDPDPVNIRPIRNSELPCPLITERLYIPFGQ